MKKQLTIILFFVSLISSYCLGQSADELTGSDSKGSTNKPKPIKKANNVSKPVSKPVPKPTKSSINVHFITTEDCWIKVNGKNRGIITRVNPKPVDLAIGKYKLFFESAETGQTLDSSFNVTADMVKTGIYTYTITFKKPVTNPPNNPVIIPPNNPVIMPPNNTVINPPKPILTDTPHNKPDVKPTKELATIKELSSNMILIPGGSFIMGVKGGKIKELMAHTVTINSIKFGKYEVTQQQWETIMGMAYNNSGNKGCSSCPVENVSWNAADSFIRKINTVSKKNFRLPTEAEWEYVARQGIEKEKVPTNEKEVENFLEQTAWYSKNSEGKTHPVGNKKPLLGIYDLLGNVAEWCFDYYKADYQKDNPNNPRGPLTGKEKLVKGGSYIDTDDLKPPVRNKEDPSTRKNTVGFRLVMEEN